MPSKHPKSPLHILYIEDNPGQARLLQRKLQRTGYTVNLALNGEQGLEEVKTGHYDIVVTDHDLPPFDGMQLIQKIQEVIQDPPAIIMITGAGNEKIAVAAIKEGASDYLVKDVEGHYLELLPSVIEKTVQQKRLTLEKEHAQKALLRSEEKFRAMFEHSPIGMLSCDTHGRILQANRAFCELFGYDLPWVPELTCCHFVTGKELASEADILNFFDENGTFGSIENSFPHRDGTMIPISITGFFYKDSEQESHIWLFIEDLRHRKDMEKRLMQSSKLEAIGELAANIAHEMNNPLGIISAKARLLLFTEKDSMSSKVASELTKMIEQTDRLSRLTRGLLDYSRPSFGIKGPVDVHHPLRKALDIIEYRAQSRQIEMLENFYADSLLIHANAHELEQVFLNLLLNAMEAMPHGGKLTIETGLQDKPSSSSHCFVALQDSGEGIPPEIQNKIFEPFFTTKAEGRGTGLGLSICFGLVRSHQGTIEVQSTPGKGSTFTVFLPML